MVCSTYHVVLRVHETFYIFLARSHKNRSNHPICARIIFFFISKNPSYIIWYIGHIENFQRAFLRSSTLVLKYPYSEVKFCKFKHVLVYNYYSTRIWANSIDFDTRFIFFSRRFSVYAWNFYIDANLLYKLFLVRLYSSKNDFLLSIQGYG